MNMISTGAFLHETDASTKQNELVKKLTAAWEKKNSKTARAGGASLMALSLAACGGEDNTPFSAADVSAAEAAATTAALTAADGVTVYASVDAAVAAGEDAADASMIAAINTALGTSLTTADDAATIISTVQTSNDAEIADAARAEGVASVDITSDNTEVMMSQADYDAAIAAADDDLQATYDALVASNATLQTAYDALVTPTSQALTTGVDAIAGTSGDDTFTAADGTIAAGDAIVDASSTDNDTLTIADTGTALASMGTISNVENVVLNSSSNAAFTVTSAANVTNSNVTINMTLPGGGTAVTVSDVGTQSSITAGDRVGALTVDYLGTRGDVSVTGGTGALSVNGSDASVAGLTVDGSNGTTVATDFGADSSNISITSGTGNVAVGSTAAAGDFDVAGLTVDASNTTGTATIDVDYGTGSSNVSVTTGDATGNVTVGAAGEAVTGLTLDATNHGGTGTITVLTATGSSGVNITLGDDAGALTATGAGVAGDITVTSTQAIGNGVTQYETVTVGVNSTTATTIAGAAAYTADANVTSLTASAAGSAQFINAAAATSLATMNLSGDNAITLRVDADVFDTTLATAPTVTTSGGAHVIALDTTSLAANVDMSGVTNNILLEGSHTGTIEVANNATLTLGAAQAATDVQGIAASQTLTVDMDGNNYTGGVQNVSTLNVTSATAATLNVTVDADADGTDAGAVINVSGAGNVTVAGTTAADSVNASASTGDISATASATIDTITTGAGDDNVTGYAGDHTVVLGDGDDTYTMGAINISTATVSVSGHEIVSFTGGATMTVAQANALLNNVTLTGAVTSVVNGTANADSLDLSNSSEGGTALTEITIDMGAGDDTVALSGDHVVDINYTSGTDGADTISGFVTTQDDFDTDFTTTAGGAGFATSASVTADTTANLTLTAAGSGSSSATDGFLITVDSLASTSEADVIAAISDGTININAASDAFMMLLNDGTSSWLFEVTASASNTTLTAADDAITHVATFTDEVLVAGDII